MTYNLHLFLWPQAATARRWPFLSYLHLVRTCNVSVLNVQDWKFTWRFHYVFLVDTYATNACTAVIERLSRRILVKWAVQTLNTKEKGNQISKSAGFLHPVPPPPLTINSLGNLRRWGYEMALLHKTWFFIFKRKKLGDMCPAKKKSYDRLSSALAIGKP